MNAFEGGGSTARRLMDWRTSDKTSRFPVQQLKGWGDKPQGNMRLKRKGVNQEFGGTSGSRRPLEHPRGDREKADICRSGVNMESSAYRWYLKSQEDWMRLLEEGHRRKDESLGNHGPGTNEQRLGR